MTQRYEQYPLPEPDESGLILVATIPGPLPPVPEYLKRHRRISEKSDAEIIAETAVAEVEADTRPMSEHFKLMKVASLVAERCLAQQNVTEYNGGSNNV